MFFLLLVWIYFFEFFLFIELTAIRRLCYNKTTIKTIKYVAWLDAFQPSTESNPQGVCTVFSVGGMCSQSPCTLKI